MECGPKSHSIFLIKDHPILFAMHLINEAFSKRIAKNNGDSMLILFMLCIYWFLCHVQDFHYICEWTTNII